HSTLVSSTDQSQVADSAISFRHALPSRSRARPTCRSKEPLRSAHAALSQPIPSGPFSRCAPDTPTGKKSAIIARRTRAVAADEGYMLITDYDRLTSEYTGLRLTVLKIHTVTDSPHFPTPRSEEHTSELQSPDHLVC